MSHVSSVCVCVCSVCVCAVYFSVCKRVFSHTRKSVLWSDQCFSRHSIRWSVMCVTGCVAGAEGARWRGERKEGWEGGRGGEVRPAAFLHSFTRFLHMMRRPWIEASRLLKSQMVIAPSMPVVQNLRQSLLSPS